jgi:transposase-like protein
MLNGLLEGWVRRRSTAQALAQRSRIALECAEGHSIMEVSRRLGVTADTVRTWRRRFIERRLDGLSDEPRPGVPRKITEADVGSSSRRWGEAEERHPLVDPVDGGGHRHVLGRVSLCRLSVDRMCLSAW